MYDIVIRFPNKQLADEFCSQMSDGFGEGLCDFSFWKQKENTSGKSNSDFVRVYDELHREVYHINNITKF